MISSISCLCQVYQQPAKISPEQRSHLGCRLDIFAVLFEVRVGWHVHVEQHVDSDHIPWGRHSRWLVTNRLKHNADKTELLWTGSKRNLFQQGLSLPMLELELGPNLITTLATMFDCWAQRFHLTSVSTEDRYVSNISTDYGSFGAFYYPWTYNRLWLQFTHLCRHTS